MIIFTIGYEGLEVSAFLSLLKNNGIHKVVDIRELPLSRKPGFSKKTLAELLLASGFEYMHMPALGCPKPVRDRYKHDGNWNYYTVGFTQYLATQQDAIAELAAMAAVDNCALLCYEADPNFCHRSMVAQAVKKYCGAQIHHIKKTADAKTRKFESLPLACA